MKKLGILQYKGGDYNRPPDAEAGALDGDGNPNPNYFDGNRPGDDAPCQIADALGGNYRDASDDPAAWATFCDTILAMDIAGLRDFRCVRSRVVDSFGVWGDQPAAQKFAACTFAPNRYSAGNLLEALGDMAAIDAAIRSWREKSKTARKTRYDRAEIRLFELLGKANALAVGVAAAALGLPRNYIDFGIETEAEDTQPGLLNWIASEGAYANGGMLALLLEGIDAPTLADASTQLLAIFNGDY